MEKGQNCVKKWKIYAMKYNLLDIYNKILWMNFSKFPQLWKLWSHYVYHTHVYQRCYTHYYFNAHYLVIAKARWGKGGRGTRLGERNTEAI